MAQYIQNAEERRRVSMALSMRHETAAKFVELRREIWTKLLNVFCTSARRKAPRDRSRPAR